jgi:hypothetical protein
MCCEFLFSLVLHQYAYRLSNIPPWVPPGHGIVFLTAFTWARSKFALQHTDVIRMVITSAAIVYGAWGLLSRRQDIGGAIGCLFFLFWLWFLGRQKSRFYSIMWVLVCYIEITGVMLGAWQWALYWGNIPSASPPSGIVGGYGLMDLTAFGLAYWLMSTYRYRILQYELAAPKRFARRRSH